MKLFRGLVRTVVTTLAAVAAVFASPAWSMTVQPVVIDLSVSGRGMSQVITVENTFATPLPVELRVQELGFDETGVKATGKESEDLLIFPPQALIQPGQTQTFRIQYVGDPDLKASKHYYVTVAQLPVKLPEGQSAIQILYNFQVLVSVSPAGAKPALAIQSSEIGKNAQGKPVPVIALSNSSAAHGYLSNGRLRIIQWDASGKEVFRKILSGPEVQQTIGFGLVGANQVRKMTLPIELPVDGGKIDATFTPEG
ncbi:fimbria/pilus periplasmic chaperone [Sphingomonas sp. MG17]|uniref:Fimbria/pilus periplasmic chaperone n=1 Tax=Sphingomonas tagetis TaxID=2949092 RepID=A0A9X2HND0_9SPHN|nr:fimbria/pilus periplasmic chaperone [Sphingomonas tagetis]MCP3729545.1 fimbria/pilus periplasmic chaperone [Sphingomonas tagetis]